MTDKDCTEFTIKSLMSITGLTRTRVNGFVGAMTTMGLCRKIVDGKKPVAVKGKVSSIYRLPVTMSTTVGKSEYTYNFVTGAGYSVPAEQAEDPVPVTVKQLVELSGVTTPYVNELCRSLLELSLVQDGGEVRVGPRSRPSKVFLFPRVLVTKFDGYTHTFNMISGEVGE